ncbi:MAG: tetratricopeptide repeat protein [bacterium]|nr:tetratricopeptide repeat protein [bacterium]
MSNATLGETLIAEGKLEQAADYFLHALEKEPNDPEILNGLGVVAFKQGKPEAAVSCFGQALAVDPSYEDAAANLCALLGTVPQEQLQANPLYAWPYLLVRASSEDWSEQDSAFLANAMATLTDLQREMLIRLFIPTRLSIHDRDISLALERMASLSDPLVSELAEWLSDSPPSRFYRDRIEDSICLKCDNDSLVRTVAHREGKHRPDSQTLPVFQFLPRRLNEPAASTDPFMKLVPKGAPTKDGLRILVIADFNIAGQLTGLMRALNKYTNHMARCVILQDDYLAYDRDVLITDQDGKVSSVAQSEAVDLIKRADFFHVGRQLLEIPGIDWNRYVSPRNAVFQYYGSELRNNGPALAKFHAQTGFTALTACDYTMYRLLPNSFYHMQPYILDMDELPKARMDTSGKLRVCHAPSGQNYRNIKRSDLILDVMHRLARENKKVESVEIAGLSNGECLSLKASCHLHIVSLLFTFGLNAIESAAQGLVPITPLDNFTMLLYPDTPVVHATPSTLYEVSRKLIADPKRLKDIGAQCRDWARREFDAKTLVQKYWYLYDLVYHGFSLDYPDQFSSRAGRIS